MILLNKVQYSNPKLESVSWRVWSQKNKDWYNCTTTTEFEKLDYKWAEAVHNACRKKK